MRHQLFAAVVATALAVYFFFAVVVPLGLGFIEDLIGLWRSKRGDD